MMVLVLESMHTSAAVVRAIQDWASQLNGLFLVTGSTGSGKTTFIEAVLEVLAPQRTAVRLTDVTAQSVGDLALRGIVDCGDIRMPNEAQAALEMSHRTLVIAALRSGKSRAALDRLISLGVEARQISAARPLIITLQLCRSLCPRCRTPCDLAEESERYLGMSRELASLVSGVVYSANGCGECDAGYKGAVPIVEAISLNENLESIELASLRNDGFVKLFAGLTSVAELRRVF